MPQDIEMSQGETVEATKKQPNGTHRESLSMNTYSLIVFLVLAMENSVGQAIDDALNKAIEAFGKALDEATEKAIEKFENRVKVLRSLDAVSVTKEANVQTSDISKDRIRTHTQNYPSPGHTYEIHVGLCEDEKLAVDKDSRLVLVDERELDPECSQGQSTTEWKCCEIDGQLYFRHAVFKGSILIAYVINSPSVTCGIMADEHVTATKLFVRQNSFGGCVLQVSGRVHPPQVLVAKGKSYVNQRFRRAKSVLLAETSVETSATFTFKAIS